MRVQDLKSPHTYSWIEGANAARQVLDYLTFTGVDNVTRPNLVAKWEASPDLKTWTFTLRNDITWRKGRKFTADDAVWNLKRLLDAKTGSSTVGLLRGFILKAVELDEIDPKTNAKKKSTALWDANAIQKVDDLTFRLNGQAPNLGIPEALFHYPAADDGPRRERRLPGRLQRHRRLRDGGARGRQARRSSSTTRSRTGAAAPTSTASRSSTTAKIQRRRSARWPRSRST